MKSSWSAVSEFGGRSILCSLGSSGLLLIIVLSCGGMMRVKTQSPLSTYSSMSHLNVIMSCIVSSMDASEL